MPLNPRADTLHSKESRKKCNEAKPKCVRCAVRELPCEYIPTESSNSHARPITRDTSSSSIRNPLQSHQDREVPSEWRTPASGILQPTAPGVSSGHLMDPFTPGLDLQSSVWNTSERLDFELDGFDLEGPMRFIESAFPTTYSSPESARSLQDGPSFFASTGPAASLASTLNISTTLCDSEKTSLLWFQEEFYETIIRKDEDHKAFNLHFIQLANFEPLLQAVLAVGAAHRAQLGPGIKSSQDLVDEGLKLHSKAVRGLKISIDNKTKCSRNAIIACTFCLLFYELIQGGFSTVTTHHLLGALHLMKTDANAGRNKTSMFHHKVINPFQPSFLYFARRVLTRSTAIPILRRHRRTLPRQEPHYRKPHL